MSPLKGLRDPVGPESAPTYWIRRAVLAGACVLVLVLIVWLVASVLGGGSSSKQADAVPSPVFTPDPSWTDTGWATPIASPSSGSPSASGSASPSGSPSASASSPSATPSGSTPGSPSPSPTAACDSSSLTAVVKGDARTIAVGGAASFHVTVTNDTGSACTWDLSKVKVDLTVTSGSDRIWSTSDCPAWAPKGTHQLAAGKAWTADVKWPGRRSNGCKLVDEDLGRGTYVATASVGGGSVNQYVFQIS